jgi:hypothetical protein
LLLRWIGRAIVKPADLARTPAWAKPIVAAALELQQDATPATSAGAANTRELRARR